MTETEQNKSGTMPGDVAGELRELGKNLAGILRSAWESDERKRLQEEIQAGLNDLGETFNEAAAEFQSSQTGQRLKEDVEEIRGKIRSGEMEVKVREEILSALRMVNNELEKTRKKPPESGDSSRGG